PAPSGFFHQLREDRNQIALGLSRSSGRRYDDRLSVPGLSPGLELMLEERSVGRKERLAEEIGGVRMQSEVGRGVKNGKPGRSVGCDRLEQRLAVKLPIPVQKEPSLIHQRGVAQAKRAVEIAKKCLADVFKRCERVVHRLDRFRDHLSDTG